ncbi:translation initiation factor IF-2-like [Schistocerca piceifrons]|uniref:translation initiation factor IF-2-like n=1 Tax=Schistocerca piceifrons TaxID=274613 RepID=UPI001F5F1C09|nr:translation initiation factor IF-2-like [Schistocerca piceifrons]
MAEVAAAAQLPAKDAPDTRDEDYGTGDDEASEASRATAVAGAAGGEENADKVEETDTDSGKAASATLDTDSLAGDEVARAALPAAETAAASQDGRQAPPRRSHIPVPVARQQGRPSRPASPTDEHHEVSGDGLEGESQQKSEVSPERRDGGGGEVEEEWEEDWTQAGIVSPGVIEDINNAARESALLVALYAATLQPPPSPPPEADALLEAALELSLDGRRRVRQAALELAAAAAARADPRRLEAALRGLAESRSPAAAAAARARLARPQLPAPAPDGLLRYGLHLPRGAAAFAAPQVVGRYCAGADVSWILSGSGALSAGSVRAPAQSTTASSSGSSDCGAGAAGHNPWADRRRTLSWAVSTRRSGADLLLNYWRSYLEMLDVYHRGGIKLITRPLRVVVSKPRKNLSQELVRPTPDVYPTVRHIHHNDGRRA